MKYFESIVAQQSKAGEKVCGDFWMCRRKDFCTYAVLCDGIGSGAYANISAITWTNRLMELFEGGMPFRDACELVAASMCRAHEEDIPFCAFSAAKVLNNGFFTIYTYEAPAPILLRQGQAEALAGQWLLAGCETIGEYIGTLELGDSLLMCSDGFTEAGMGRGYTYGIRSQGLAEYITGQLSDGVEQLQTLLNSAADMTARISGGFYADDSTALALHCREANQLTIATGPPLLLTRDREFAERFVSHEGLLVICGSTTAEVIGRELGRDVTQINTDDIEAPPEFRIQGIDLATEGAVMLNRVYNIMDEDIANITGHNVVERLCRYLLTTDVVNVMQGRAVNPAHKALLFKQMAIKPRAEILQMIYQALRKMGKIVETEVY